MYQCTYYFHSGKLGDVIFSIPAFRWSQRTAYALVDDASGGFWHYRPGAVVSLLEAQGIRVEVWRGRGVVVAPAGSVNGDRFRAAPRRGFASLWRRPYNLAERHLLSLGGPVSLAAVPWLVAEPRKVQPVIFARSPRYRPDGCPVDWRFLVNQFAGRCCFLGLREEWRALEDEWDCRLPYYPTSNLLEVAEVLAGASLLVCNQSSIHAVAAGLHRPLLLEVGAGIDCCRFGRAGEWTSTAGLLSAIHDGLIRPFDHRL